METLDQIFGNVKEDYMYSWEDAYNKGAIAALEVFKNTVLNSDRKLEASEILILLDIIIQKRKNASDNS